MTAARISGYVWPIPELPREQLPTDEVLRQVMASALTEDAKSHPGKDRHVVSVFRRGDSYRVTIGDA